MRRPDSYAERNFKILGKSSISKISEIKSHQVITQKETLTLFYMYKLLHIVKESYFILTAFVYQ